MNTNGKPKLAFDGYQYTVNRSIFPVEELQKYAGQWVAFSRDGKKILASHPDPMGVTKLIDDAGISREDVIFEPVYADEVGLA
jgi:Family of unknown function (DUF5678)